MNNMFKLFYKSITYNDTNMLETGISVLFEFFVLAVFAIGLFYA